MTQLQEIFGEWFTPSGICLEFLSMNATFLIGKLKYVSDNEHYSFKSVYQVREQSNSNRLIFSFIIDLKIGDTYKRCVFQGTTKLNADEHAIKLTCLGTNVIENKSQNVFKQSTWNFYKSPHCFNFASYPVHEENGFFDPVIRIDY